MKNKSFFLFSFPTIEEKSKMQNNEPKQANGITHEQQTKKTDPPNIDHYHPDNNNNNNNDQNAKNLQKMTFSIFVVNNHTTMGNQTKE